LRVPSGHEVAFAPDGKSLAVTVSPARQKYLLQVVDATQRKIVKGVDLGEPIFHLQYAPDGRCLAACTRGSVWLFDNQTFQRRLLGQHPTQVPAGYFGGASISALAMSHDGRLLATGGFEGRPTVRLWDLRTGRLAHILQHPAGHVVNSLAFSPDGSQLVSGVNWDEDGEGAVCLWDLPMRSAPKSGACY
jgi:WD40 repeat protein